MFGSAGGNLLKEILINLNSRFYVIAAALLALFLGALDTLVMGAAMPTIVADLGGLHLYSWVFSVYLLTRAVSLPIFGKLCDIFNSKKLYTISIVIFLLSSVLAGVSQNMTQLTFSRALQGVGAGGNFALAYIVLADISPPEKRGKMMALASFVWGIASVLGPTLGGFIVNYFSWRWIFFINIPLGSFALMGILMFLTETREKKREAPIDYLGVLTLSTTILALLTAFLLGGRTYAWTSPQVIGLLMMTLVSGTAFYHAEKRAREPILPLSFFRVQGFSIGNGAAFFASFAVFSLSAFSPLFIQGALGKTPAQLGVAMVPLSLGWSLGALACGQWIHLLRERPFALLGSFLLVAGSGMTLTFSTSTSLIACSTVFAVAGLGMGFVSISTLLIPLPYFLSFLPACRLQEKRGQLHEPSLYEAISKNFSHSSFKNHGFADEFRPWQKSSPVPFQPNTSERRNSFSTGYAIPSYDKCPKVIAGSCCPWSYNGVLGSVDSIYRVPFFQLQTSVAKRFFMKTKKKFENYGRQ